MAPPMNAQMASPVSEADAVISLLVTETGQVLHLAGRSEYTIGRISDGQPILPDVDLSTYDAFSQGVSRLHVSLKITKNGVVVNDLGSSNGTRVNGKKIIPHVEYLINHGDTLALGKFKFQILIHR
jgi:pSer/pThr/pTyr-binding forkhead associated (FHA) protein